MNSSVDMATETQTSPTPFLQEAEDMEGIFSRAAFLLVAGLVISEARLICHHDSYSMREGFCYRYVVSSVTYSQATERCERDQHGAGMLYINSASENNYIWSEMFSGHDREEFWLGLDDQVNEGDFRWSHNKSRPIYTNYSEDIDIVNNENYDCVKFSESGWQIAEGFCENVQLPFVCKAPVCESSDGVICDEVRVSESGGGGLSAGAIAAIVIIIVIFICVAVVLVILILLWKFKNDMFRHYICPCIGRGSKQAMLSLQQENQRLRQELNQSKMNTSSRFTSGHFGRESVSGVPDGMGGMLPPLKPGVGYRNPDPAVLSSPTRPPPLSLQRSTSRVTPMTPSGPPLFSPPPPPSLFSTQTQRATRQSVSGGSGRAVTLLTTLKEQDREDSSSATDDDTSLEKLALPESTGEDKTKPADSAQNEISKDREETADMHVESGESEVKGQENEDEGVETGDGRTQS